MAIFNPDVQVEKSREYLGLSQPIESRRNIAPEGRAANAILPTGIKHTDVSGQLAYEGTGNLISSGAKLGSLLATEADTIIKDHIQNEVTTNLEGKRDRFIAGLLGQKGKLTQAGVPATDDEVARQEGTQADPVGGSDETTGMNVPDDVKQVPIVLGKIANAKATRQDRFELDMKAYNYLKEMRSRWGGAGGYAPYIDNVAESLGFGNSANRVIAGALARVNAAGASQDREFKLQEARAFKAMGDGLIGEQQYAAVTRREPGAYEAILPKIAKFGALEAKVKENEMKMKDTQYGDFFADRASSSKADELMWKGYTAVLNPGATEKSASAAAELALRAQEGNIQLDPKQVTALGETITAGKARFRADMIKYATETTDARGQPIYMAAGGLDKYIDKHIKPREEIFDVGIKALGAKDYSLVARTGNHVAAMVDDQANKLFNTSAAQFLYRVGGLYKYIGGNGQSFGPVAIQQSIVSGNMDAVGQWLVDDHEGAIINNTNPNPATVTTPKGSITDAQGKKQNIPDMPRVIDGFLKGYEKVTDPKYQNFPQVQAALVRGVYDTSNKGLVDKFAGKDKYDVYARFTSPEFTAQAAKVDKMYPGLGIAAKMRDWSGSEFMTLFKQDIASLNEVAKTSGFDVQFNIKTNQFEVLGTAGGAGQVRSNIIFPYVARINSAISSFSNVPIALGEEPASRIYAAMYQMGFRDDRSQDVSLGGPSVGDRLKAIRDSVGDRLMKAIKDSAGSFYQSNKPPKKAAE